jgi:hypothetical protein
MRFQTNVILDISDFCRAEKPVDKARSQFRIAKSSRNAKQMDLRTLQRQRQRVRIIDVVADVCIQDCGLPRLNRSGLRMSIAMSRS